MKQTLATMYFLLRNKLHHHCSNEKKIGFCLQIFCTLHVQCSKQLCLWLTPDVIDKNILERGNFFLSLRVSNRSEFSKFTWVFYCKGCQIRVYYKYFCFALKYVSFSNFVFKSDNAISGQWWKTQWLFCFSILLCLCSQVVFISILKQNDKVWISK